MTILLATNNDHKKRELARIFSNHKVVVPADLDVTFEYEETADTFLGNALGKATAVWKAMEDLLAAGDREPGDIVVVADDSGLCVAALGGRPGIYSARYGSPDGGRTELASEDRNRLLLEELSGVSDRSAHFVCCMVAVFSPDRFAVVQETFEGEIADSPSGVGGFGYDPVFVLPDQGLTVAELPEDEKNRISHRGKAAARLARMLDREPADSLS